MLHSTIRATIMTGLMGAVILLRLCPPAFHEHCMCRNCCGDGFSETGTIATLRNLCYAQRLFREACSCDEDGDGRGEAGGFAELSGGIGVRGGAPAEPVLSTRFAEVRNGCVERNGYYYRIYVPRRGGGFVGEQDAGGFPAGTVDPASAASSWWAYAWPVREERIHWRTFFISGTEYVLATSGYAAGDAPRPDAALDAEGQPAVDAIGSDGRLWKHCG